MTTVTKRRSYDSINGVRVLMSAWVMYLHMFAFLATISPDSPSAARYQTLPWTNFAKGYGCQVDVFFAISGFLIVMSVLQGNDDNPNIFQTMLAWIVKRALRMWPALCVSMGLMLYLGDFNIQLPRLIWSVLTFQTNVQTDEFPFSFMVTWSNSVDVQVGAVLLVVILLLKQYGQLKPTVLWSLVGISIALNTWIYLQDPANRGIIAAFSRNITRLNWVSERQQFVLDSAGIDYPTKPVVRGQFGAYLYLPSYTRWGPMVLGGLLALRVYHGPKHDPQPRSWWKLIICGVTTVLLMLPPPPPTLGAPVPKPVDYFVTILLRLCFTVLWCEILYPTLVDASHPSHIGWLFRFLSAKPFALLAELSYPMYVLHMRLGLLVCTRLLHPAHKDIWAPLLGAEFGFLHTTLCFAATYIITFALAYVVHKYVELPIWRHRDIILRILGLSDDHNKAKKAA